MSPTAQPAALVSQQALIGLDPNLVVSEPRTLQSIIDESLMFIELPAILFGACGLMGLLIASIGVYGVMSFAVARRFKEFGIRRALGAQGVRIVGGVVSHGAAVAAVGLTLGLSGGYGLARVAESLVFGVNGSDARTYVTVAAVILGVALCASAVPAARAANIHPSETLRSE
jgi:putative ABC transport system permease protein